MSNGHQQADNRADLAPGDEHAEGSIGLRVLGYLTGLGLAILLTATSFFIAGTDLVWQPSIPVALVVLAIAQMGVHLVFFLHITTGPDNTNNVLALGLTATSFWVAYTHLLWAPGVPIGLCVLAIAQMGVHLVFFLHITTGPDNTNNVLALAFGVMIVFLVVVGSLWIMANLNHNMAPMAPMTGM